MRCFSGVAVSASRRHLRRPWLLLGTVNQKIRVPRVPGIEESINPGQRSRSRKKELNLGARMSDAAGRRRLR